MAKFDLRIGATVHCDDGRCGTLSHVVVDPHTQRVTDLIVAKGFLLKSDRVLPVESVERATERDVYVAIKEEELEEYPEYEKVTFEEPDPEMSSSSGYGRGDVQCWSSGYNTVCQQPVVPMVRREVEKGVSPELAVIERGTDVKSAQGIIGQVDHLLMDPESGQVTHVVLRRGLIPYYPVIPMTEIDSVGDEAVTVRFDEDQINEFPRYKSRAAEDIRAELMDRVADEDLDVGNMEVSVESGIVTLTGSVATIADKRRAEALARSTPGVIDVENALDTDVALETRVDAGDARAAD